MPAPGQAGRRQHIWQMGPDGRSLCPPSWLLTLSGPLPCPSQLLPAASCLSSGAPVTEPRRAAELQAPSPRPPDPPGDLRAPPAAHRLLSASAAFSLTALGSEPLSAHVSRFISEAPCQMPTETQMSARFLSSSRFVPVIEEHGGSS